MKKNLTLLLLIFSTLIFSHIAFGETSSTATDVSEAGLAGDCNPNASSVGMFDDTTPNVTLNSTTSPTGDGATEGSGDSSMPSGLPTGRPQGR